MTGLFLVVVAAIVAGWNLWLLHRSVGDWRFVRMHRINGPREIIAFSTILRIGLTLVLHVSLIVLIATPALTGERASLATVLLLFTIILGTELLKNGVETYVRHALQWFLLNRGPKP